MLHVISLLTTFVVVEQNKKKLFKTIKWREKCSDHTRKILSVVRAAVTKISLCVVDLFVVLCDEQQRFGLSLPHLVVVWEFFGKNLSAIMKWKCDGCARIDPLGHLVTNSWKI